MQLEYSFSQPMGRCRTSQGGDPDRYSYRKSGILPKNNQYQDENIKPSQIYREGHKKRNSIDELSIRMLKLLEQLRADNKEVGCKRKHTQEDLNRVTRSYSQTNFKRSTNQSISRPNRQLKTASSYYKDVNHKYYQQKSLQKINPSKSQIPLAQMDNNRQSLTEKSKPVANYAPYSRKIRMSNQKQNISQPSYSGMKMKVKTIESQNGDQFDAENSISYQYDELNSKSSNASDVYKRFSCFGGKIQQYPDMGKKIITQPSSNYSTNGAFQQKVREISLKIDNYQKKVGSICVDSSVKDKRKRQNYSNKQGFDSMRRNNQQDQLNSFRMKEFVRKEQSQQKESKYKKVHQQFPSNKRQYTQSEEAVNRIMNKYLNKNLQNEEKFRSKTNKSDRITQLKEPSSQYSPIDQIKVCTPTWRNNSPINNSYDSLGSSKYQSRAFKKGEGSRNRFYMDQYQKQQTLVKNYHESSTNFQYCSNKNSEKLKQKENFSKYFGTSNLKERMAEKLNLDKAQQKINKQILLDEQFRKAKKDLSKLPDFIGKIEKWDVLIAKLRDMGFAFDKDELISIFGLTDDEADPFYSIQIDGMKEFQQIIDKCVGQYLSSEGHFAEQILENLSLEQVQTLIGKQKDGEIRLDEFTILISNFTKNTMMCRDTIMLYKRICALSQGNKLTRQSLQECLACRK